MAAIGNAQLPVPGGAQAPTTPGDLAALAAAIDPHLWQHVTTKAARDSTYAQAPIHTVVTAEDGSVWVKTSTTNVWATIWEPIAAWRPINLAAGIGVSGDTTPSVRIVDGYVHMLGAVNKSDSTYFTGDALLLGTVPTDCVPARRRRYGGTASLAGDTTDAAVRIEITGASETTPGQVLAWYQATGGTPWVDLGGGYWKDGPA